MINTTTYPYTNSPNLGWKRCRGIVTSPLILSLIFTTAIALTSYYSGNLETSLRLSILAASAIITVSFIVNKRKVLLYEVSLIKSILSHAISEKSYPWWNKVTDQIYLGAIPLENQKHPKQLSDIGITHFVSLVEPFEFQPSIFSSPISYNLASKNVLQLPTRDFTGVKIEDLEQGVEWMHNTINKGGKVYIHCKAGKGRSALLVLCYLCKYGNISSDNAFTFLKGRRNVINLNKKQLKTFRDFCAKHPSIA